MGSRTIGDVRKSIQS